MPGELGGRPGVVAVSGRQGGREPGVQAGPLPRQQLGVDRLLDQGVPEPVGAVAGVGQQHVGRDGLAQPGQQLGLGQAGHLGQEGVGHGGPGHGHDLQHPLGRLGQQLDKGQQGSAGRAARARPAVVAPPAISSTTRVSAERAWTPGQLGGPRPLYACKRAATSAGPQLASPALPRRPRPARQDAAAVDGVQLVGSVGADSSSRPWRRFRTRNASMSRVERSAQCRSSTTSRPCPRPPRAQHPSSSSNSRPAPTRAGSPPNAGPLPGRAGVACPLGQEGASSARPAGVQPGRAGCPGRGRAPSGPRSWGRLSPLAASSTQPGHHGGASAGPGHHLSARLFLPPRLAPIRTASWCRRRPGRRPRPAGPAPRSGRRRSGW